MVFGWSTRGFPIGFPIKKSIYMYEKRCWSSLVFSGKNHQSADTCTDSTVLNLHHKFHIETHRNQRKQSWNLRKATRGSIVPASTVPCGGWTPATSQKGQCDNRNAQNGVNMGKLTQKIWQNVIQKTWFPWKMTYIEFKDDFSTSGFVWK